MSRVLGRRVSVGTTATRLDTVEGNDRTGQKIIVKNPSASAASVDVGGATVTSGAGFELEAGASMSAELTDYDEEAVYAITASGTVTVHIFETGV